MAQDPWQRQVEAFGEYVRAQRKLAKLSLRELAARAEISNAYLSQIERGLHAPSVRVLRSLADAFEVSAETILEQAGLLDDERDDEKSRSRDRGCDPGRSHGSPQHRKRLSSPCITVSRASLPPTIEAGPSRRQRAGVAAPR